MKNLLISAAIFLFSQDAPAQSIDSIRTIDSSKVLKSVTGKIIADSGSKSRRNVIIIFDTVAAGNPLDIYDYERYPNMIYAGIMVDLNSKHFDQGGAGLYIGYKKHIPLRNHWGINGILSSVFFIHGPAHYYTGGSVPDDYPGKRYSENNFSLSFHAAPSYIFGDNGMIYAGIGMNFLDGKEFTSNGFSGPYSIDKPRGELLFSQVIGIELPLINNKWVINFEYNRTSRSNLVSCKAGMHF